MGGLGPGSKARSCDHWDWQCSEGMEITGIRALRTLGLVTVGPTGRSHRPVAEGKREPGGPQVLVTGKPPLKDAATEQGGAKHHGQYTGFQRTVG